MSFKSLEFFLEINEYKFYYTIVEYDSNGNFEIVLRHSGLNPGIVKGKIQDFDLISKNIKENIYSIEKKLNFTFKDVILILSNFECSVINFSGYKKLNGSQLTKENITYIINSLKSQVDKTEKNKKILHIFNSDHILDKKNIENIPIGLFGDFYSHELSFFLINNNDYRNLKNLINNCNLNIKKAISKNFLENIYFIKEYDINSFFNISINENNSNIVFFKNSSLKFFQSFNFGTDIIVNDISKVLAIEKEKIKKLLISTDFKNIKSGKDLIEKEYFDQNFRKVKKKMVLDIAQARIQEMCEVIFTKNINIDNFLKEQKLIILQINDETNFQFFKESFKGFFSNHEQFELKIANKFENKFFFKNAGELVQFGWKKEAIPIIQERKSIIARIFDFLFN